MGAALGARVAVIVGSARWLQRFAQCWRVSECARDWQGVFGIALLSSFSSASRIARRRWSIVEARLHPLTHESMYLIPALNGLRTR